NRAFESAGAVRGRPDFVALAPEAICECEHQAWLVLNEEDTFRSCGGRHYAMSAGAAGSRKVNVVPEPGVDDTSIWPPCASAIRDTRHRPSPLPCICRSTTARPR